jgi:hypothetical protein
MQKTKNSIKDYIQSLPEEKRIVIEHLHTLISKIDSKVDVVMWEGIFWGGTEQKIIGYGEYKYKASNGKEGEWFVVGLTAQKNYYSVFVNGVEDGQNIIKKYQDTLGKVKTGSGSITIKKLEDLDEEGLKKLIKKAFMLHTKLS